MGTEKKDSKYTKREMRLVFYFTSFVGFLLFKHLYKSVNKKL